MRNSADTVSYTHLDVYKRQEGCQTISGFDYGIPKRRAFIFSFTKAGARFSSAPAPCADRHARQPAPFFSIQNSADVYKRQLLRSAFAGKQNDKPGYVVNGHLSSPAVAGRLKRPT